VQLFLLHFKEDIPDSALLCGFAFCNLDKKTLPEKINETEGECLVLETHNGHGGMGSFHGIEQKKGRCLSYIRCTVVGRIAGARILIGIRVGLQ
jgi:hypothetical protein